MDPTTDKYHITGVGCASAVPLLRLASQTLPGHPGKHSLVVAAESMSSILMPATADDPRAKTVGSAIFGDGCAAALVSAAEEAQGPVILASQVHQIGGTLGAVSLTLSPQDSHLHLARELPDLAAAGLGELVADFLRRHRTERADVDHWIVHPGGRRIIECVQDALELSREDVGVSWDALADHGNVGTPSILYVLKSTIDARRPRSERRPDALAILSHNPECAPSRSCLSSASPRPSSDSEPASKILCAWISCAPWSAMSSKHCTPAPRSSARSSSPTSRPSRRPPRSRAR
jgi:predicted naringenin-chalcone synthase